MSATRISGQLEHRAVEHGNLSVKPDLTDKDSHEEQWTKVEGHRRGQKEGFSDQQDEEDDTSKTPDHKAYETLSIRKLNELYDQVIPEAHIYGRNFDRSKAGKRIDNIAGYMGVSVKLPDKGTFLIRDVPEIGVVITTVPLSHEFTEQAPLNIVGEKKIGDLMKVIKEAQQFNFFDLNRGFGETGNCIATVGAARYFLESLDQGVSIPYNINEEQCKQAHYDVLVDQLHRFPDLQEFMRSNEQSIQALLEELHSNPQFQELNLLVNPDEYKQQPPKHDINIGYAQYKGIDRIAKGYTSGLNSQPRQEHQQQHEQQ